MSYTIFVPIGSCSRKSPFICIKFKDSEFCCVAGHASAGHAANGRYRSLLPMTSIICFFFNRVPFLSQVFPYFS